MQQLKQNAHEAHRANPFRRAWNHLTDLEKSPVLRSLREMKERRISRLLEEVKSGWRVTEHDPILEKIVDNSAEKKIVKMGRHAVPALIVALGDSNESVRGSAALAFWRIAENGGDCSSAVPMLIKALGDSDKWVRGSAAGALWKIAEKNPNVIFDAIISHVNGNGGDALVVTDSETSELFNRLDDLLRECAMGMENAA